MEVEIGKECDCRDLGQHIERSKQCRVAHQGEINELFDLAAVELQPDPLIFAPRLVVGRMRRPLDAE